MSTQGRGWIVCRCRAFHRRIMWLIGIGMFFDGFDIYVASTVLGATLKTGFSTLGQNALFVSLTFLGMMLGSLGTGFLGDRFGRRFTYQANLVVFGLASLGAALAPNMSVLIACRFVMGLGLGAENVVGYSTLTEFVPPQKRGKLQGLMAVFVVSGLPVAGLIGLLLIPAFGWRAMFVLGGIRRARRVVRAQVAAGIAALARFGWPPRGSRRDPATHRSRSCRDACRRAVAAAVIAKPSAAPARRFHSAHCSAARCCSG